MGTPTIEHVEEQLRHLSPENLAIVADFIASLEPPTRAEPDANVPSGDPWAGFYGAFEASVPDLLERHDYYIGQEALNRHETDPRVVHEENADDNGAS